MESVSFESLASAAAAAAMPLETPPPSLNAADLEGKIPRIDARSFLAETGQLSEPTPTFLSAVGPEAARIEKSFAKVQEASVLVSSTCTKRIVPHRQSGSSTAIDAVYEGLVKGDTPHGLGFMSIPTDVLGKFITQTGIFYDGVIRFGEVIYPGGHKKYARYVGSFLEGRRHGHGLMQFASSGKHSGATYVGAFDNGLPDGFGTYAYPDGSVYTGDFVKGQAKGQGEQTSINGLMYSGSWDNDQRHGMGTLMSPDGSVYIGEWYRDSKANNFRITYPNGDVTVCVPSEGHGLWLGIGETTNSAGQLISKAYYKGGEKTGWAVSVDWKTQTVRCCDCRKLEPVIGFNINCAHRTIYDGPLYGESTHRGCFRSITDKTRKLYDGSVEPYTPPEGERMITATVPAATNELWSICVERMQARTKFRSAYELALGAEHSLSRVSAQCMFLAQKRDEERAKNAPDGTISQTTSVAATKDDRLQLSYAITEIQQIFDKFAAGGCKQPEIAKDKFAKIFTTLTVIWRKHTSHVLDEEKRAKFNVFIAKVRGSILAFANKCTEMGAEAQNRPTDTTGQPVLVDDGLSMPCMKDD